MNEDMNDLDRYDEVLLIIDPSLTISNSCLNVFVHCTVEEAISSLRIWRFIKKALVKVGPGRGSLYIVCLFALSPGGQGAWCLVNT